jgi:hypothetical protein
LEGLRDGTVPARRQLVATIPVLRMVETASSFQSEISGAVEHGRADEDDGILQVYILVTRLLPRVANFGHDHIGRLKALVGAETLCRNAATRAIVMAREEEAVEMLEEGRGVFWAQALRLRGAELDVLPPEDAQELK